MDTRAPEDWHQMGNQAANEIFQSKGLVASQEKEKEGVKRDKKIYKKLNHLAETNYFIPARSL